MRISRRRLTITPRSSRCAAGLPSRSAIPSGIALIFLLVASGAISAQERSAEPARETNGSGVFDLSWARFYVDVRMGVSIATAPLAEGFTSGRGDLYEASIGVDLGRYTGVELGLSLWEYGLDSEQRGRVGEWSAYTYLPTFRLRYPLLGDRLVPYGVVGIGLGFAELNDKTRAAGGDPPLISGVSTSTLAWSVGGGLQYFIARNVTLGIDAKYQLLDREIRVLGEPTTASTRTLLLSGSVGAYFPEVPPAGQLAEASWREADPLGVRPYLSFRFGARLYLDGEFPGGTRKTSSEQLNSGSLGVQLGRHVAIELVAETQEFSVEADGVKLAEYATWNVLPTVMGRYPLSDGRWVPYATLGLGVGDSDTNDRTDDNGQGFPYVTGGSTEFIWAAGLGLDLFLADNVTLIGEAKYVSQTSSVLIDGVDEEVDMSAILASAGFRVFFR